MTEKNVDMELAHSIVVGSAVDAFRALLTEIYLPSLASQESSGPGNQKSLNEFLQVLRLFLLRLFFVFRLGKKQETVVLRPKRLEAAKNETETEAKAKAGREALCSMNG